MSFSQRTTNVSLSDSVKNSLLRAAEMQIESISFPAIGTGIAGYPSDKCAQIMIGEARAFLRNHEYPHTINFVLFDEDSYTVFRQEYEKSMQVDNT